MALSQEIVESECVPARYPFFWFYPTVLKTNYIAHLAAACGNVVTIEGVTRLSDDIDYGDYKITDGKIGVSEKPGFGMALLVR